MVKYKYIGQTTYQFGKTLWEILGNLENLGVGRLVTRGMFLRYPEPSFYKIVKVITENEPVTTDSPRKVIAWCEVLIRGRRLPNLRELLAPTYKPDYQLIPKEEEEIWYKRVAESKPVEKIFHPYVATPPLLKLVIAEEQKKKGKPIEEDPKLEISLATADNNYQRIAEEGETPTHFCRSDFGISLHPSLVANIDECRDIFVGQDPWNDPPVVRKIKWTD